MQGLSIPRIRLPTTAQDDDPVSHKVRAQAIDFLYRTLPGIIISITLMPIMMVIVMWQQADRVLLLSWYGMALLVTASRLLLNRTYARRQPVLQDTPRWGHYYTLTSLASGIIWGMAGVLFFSPDSTAHQVFLYTSIVGLCAGSIILNSYWIASYYAFAIPALALPSVRMLLEEDIGYKSLAVLAWMLGAVLIQVAHRTRRSAFAAMRLGFENIDLVDRLREEKERAENASHDKTRFLAAASHDLRQPVHALTLFANALRPEQTSEKGRALLADMDESIYALNQLLESLIDISKLDADIVKPSRVHFALGPLIDRLHNEYLPEARARGLDWNAQADRLIVDSDPTLLEAILRNLISNALRYTPNGRVDLTCRKENGEVHIAIRDTGIGIPASLRQEIFREFYQVDNPERDRSKGLGLGLAIVDRLISLLGHRLSLDSTLGKGSCFTVIVPLGNRAALAPTAINNAALDSTDVAGMTVLVIDDELAIRKGMHALLESWGCRVYSAGQEDEAMEKIRTGGMPDTVIADYRLRDGRTGVHAIEQLRRALGFTVPALIMTGDTAPERLREAQASGHTLMHKPLHPAKLRAFLRRVRRRKLDGSID